MEIHMIKFKIDTTLQVITEFDEKTDNITEECEEYFKKGELVDADIYEEDGDNVSIQFGDGSVAMGIQRSCFEVVE